MLNIPINIAEATEKELEKIKSAYEIRLVTILSESGTTESKLTCAK